MKGNLHYIIALKKSCDFSDNYLLRLTRLRTSCVCNQRKKGCCCIQENLFWMFARTGTMCSIFVIVYSVISASDPSWDISAIIPYRGRSRPP